MVRLADPTHVAKTPRPRTLEKRPAPPGGSNGYGTTSGCRCQSPAGCPRHGNPSPAAKGGGWTTVRSSWSSRTARSTWPASTRSLPGSFPAKPTPRRNWTRTASASRNCSICSMPTERSRCWSCSKAWTPAAKTAPSGTCSATSTPKVSRSARSRCRRPRNSRTTFSGASTLPHRGAGRSRSSIVPTTRTCWWPACTSSCPKRSGRSATGASSTSRRTSSRATRTS